MVYLHPRGVPFPPRYRTRVRTCIQGNIVAATAPAVYTVSGNSAYHPFAGGGWPGVLVASIATLNPAGFSNLCASLGPYSNYRVYKSFIKVRMTPTVATDVVTFCLGCPAGAVFTSVSDGLAEARTKSTIAQSGATLQSIEHAMSTSTFFGVSEAAIQSDVVGIYSAAYNASPTQGWLWNLAWTTSNGGTLGGAVSYEVEILHDIEFWNLLTGSLLDN